MMIAPEDRKLGLGLGPAAFHRMLRTMPVGTKLHPNVFASVERLEDDKRGRAQFRMVASRLPKITEDGLGIDPRWFSSDKGWFTRVNCGIAASVTDKGVLVASKGKTARWTPRLFVGGREYTARSGPKIIDDPMNENYRENCLSWDYGACERRLRVIEGALREMWVFTKNPEAEIRIEHGMFGDMEVKIGSAYSLNPQDGPIACAAVGDVEIVAAASLVGVVGPFVVGASATYNPDPHTETSSVDGRAYMYNAAPTYTWSEIRDGAGTHAIDNGTVGGVQLTSYTTENVWKILSRDIYVFNTAGLPDTATISAATLSLRGQTKADGFTGFNGAVNVYSSAPASNTAIAAGDYDSLGTTAYCDTAIAYASILTSSTFNTWAFNATGIAAISKTAVTKLGLREVTHDVANSAPTWESDKTWKAQFYQAEQGAGYLPELAVTYTDAGAGWAHTFCEVASPAEAVGVVAASLDEVCGVT